VHANFLEISKENTHEAEFFVLKLRNEYVIQLKMKKIQASKEKAKNFYIAFFLEIF
jgi:hypothetical protein